MRREVPSFQSARDWMVGKVLLREGLGSDLRSNQDFLKRERDLQQCYADVWRWHGTGRFQYRQEQVIDVLEGIISQRGLMPHYDIWDSRATTRNTISTSPSRMYSRLYAGMHFEKGKHLDNQFKSNRFWLNYFLGYAAYKYVKEYKPDWKVLLERNSVSKWNKVFPEQDELKQVWVKKISKKPIDFFEVFEGKSDIAGNYPILLGIKNLGLPEVQTSRCLSKHEKRYVDPILISGFTHIEVPLENVSETVSILKKYSLEHIPVWPMEWGEELCRSFTFSQLEGTAPLGSTEMR